MANSTAPKQKITSPPPSSRGLFGYMRRHPVVALLVLLVAAGVAFIPIHNYQTKQAIEADKRRFAQADKDVQKVVADIIAVTGEPYKSEKNNRCFLPSVEYEEQPISCTVDRTLYYVVSGPSEATILLHQIRQNAQKVWRENKAPRAYNTLDRENFQALEIIKQSSSNDYQQILEVYNDHLSNMTCRLTYYFYPGGSPPYVEFAKSPNNSILYANISCNDDAKIIHYRVRE